MQKDKYLVSKNIKPMETAEMWLPEAWRWGRQGGVGQTVQNFGYLGWMNSGDEALSTVTMLIMQDCGCAIS